MEPIKIILIEDNPAHAQLIKRTLGPHEDVREIIHLDDGEKVFDFFEDFDKSGPFLVLLDLRLPKVDGLEVLRFLKTNPDLQHIPVVVLSTSKAGEDLARAYEYHVNSYLVKPVSYDAFSKMMADLSSYWILWNHQV